MWLLQEGVRYLDKFFVVHSLTVPGAVIAISGVKQ